MKEKVIHNLTGLEHPHLPDCSNTYNVYSCVQCVCVSVSLSVCASVSVIQCFGLTPTSADRLAEFGSWLCHLGQIS